jgi:hypothetical protein
MPNYFFLLLFTGLSLSLSAQDAFFSEVINNESGQNPLVSITENTNDKKYVLITHHQKNGLYQVYFSELDSTLQKSGNASYEWKIGANDGVQFLAAGFFQKKHHAFFSVTSETNLTNELFVIEYSNGKAEVKMVEKLEIKNISNHGSFKVNISPSGKTILVTTELPVDKSKNESARFSVYDEKLNKITDLSLSFSVTSKPNPVNKPFVTDRGDIYLIKKDREKTDYKFFLYAYNAELKGWNQKQITIPGKKIADIDAGINSSQEFIVAGFFNTLDVSSYEGYFYYCLDASLKYVSKATNPFTSEFLSEFIGKKAASKEGAVISGYYFENLITAPDNNCYIIAEIEEQNEQNYKYGDILYLQLSKDGNIRNAGKVKNNQESNGDDGEWSSFNYASVKDTLHLFHNEVSASASKSKFGEEALFGTYHSRLTKGNTSTTLPEKEMIFTGEKMAFHPDFVYQTSDNHIIYILLTQDKMKYVAGKMKLK